MNNQALKVSPEFSKLFNAVLERAKHYGVILEKEHLMNKVKLAIRNLAVDPDPHWIDTRNNNDFDYHKCTQDESLLALYYVSKLLEINQYRKQGRAL